MGDVIAVSSGNITTGTESQTNYTSDSFGILAQSVGGGGGGGGSMSLEILQSVAAMEEPLVLG